MNSPEWLRALLITAFIGHFSTIFPCPHSHLPKSFAPILPHYFPRYNSIIRNINSSHPPYGAPTSSSCLFQAQLTPTMQELHSEFLSNLSRSDFFELLVQTTRLESKVIYHEPANIVLKNRLPNINKKVRSKV